MAYVIHRQTKEIGTMDTVEALARQDEFTVFHKTEVPKDVVSAAPQYRVIEGDKVRVATEAERAEIDEKIAAERLPEQKLAKLAELDVAQAAREKAGVSIGNITLASSEYDQRRLATLLVGINEALTAGLYSTESAVSVTTANDVDVEITVGQFKLLAIAYMGRCMEQRVQYRRAKAQIESAISQAELDGIEV